ncbi:holo-ACP synthase [Tessaracoccus sp. MC1865]|uniref:holo-ACP synthase n=1 Tax=unclassified Tessaracoccus TaxID=2635419 RepID=UPI0016049C45|nr:MULTISPECIES: holo-ACP synthase [unclassified Tessaracoccus]MBB1482272.1 holo-ACP synthase [Tessaracoccus sp. MC1865]MBB1509517.1 holo-ACP synthase [Tessaracoccus sp. MC1756]QTO38257.1 holo-ACP synthase [Tessaracoccus sp. MC1865]
MIVGIGTDLVVIERFKRMLEERPKLGERLLTDGERKLSVESQAARFSAKEALAKALGSPGGMRWLDCEVVRSDEGVPSFATTGSVAARIEALGVRRIHLSISHDGGFATTMVVCEA